MKKLLIFLLSLTAFAQTVTYSPSTDIIANPERGLQKYSSTASGSILSPQSIVTYNQLNQNTLLNWRNSTDKVTVIYRYYILPSVDIPTIYITNMQNDFNIIRNTGFKVIIRFAYTSSCNLACQNGTNPQQPNKSQILAHITQLTNVINSNKDVIFSIQVGFIGTWGEFYYTGSSEFGHAGNINTIQWNNRRDIVNAMLSNFDIDIPLQVRYADAKRQLGENISPTNYGQRLGFYNDAFLNQYGDMGTYNVSQCANPVESVDFNFVATTSKFLPMTGETNGVNPCNSGARTLGVNAINEMNLLSFTTLNRDYFTQNWNNWIASNHYNEIVTRLGYRFTLISSVLNGNTLTINFINSGFARPFKQKNVFVVFRNGSNIIKRPINTDTRFWNKGNNTISFNIPTDIPVGTYDLLLHVVDTNLNRPEYSIQFANQGIWESNTGFNKLNQVFTRSENIFQNVVITPNPFVNQINIIGINDYTVRIRNSRNRNVSFSLVNNTITLNVSRGTYFLIITKSGQSRTYTIIRN